MLKKALSFVLVLCLGLSLLTLAAHAENSEAVTVYVRVESSLSDDEQTLLPATPVTVEAAASVLDALLAAADQAVDYIEGEAGSFVTGILGVSDDTGQYAWMYAVNNVLPSVSADNLPANNGDEIVFYFIDWQAAMYAYFDRSAVFVQGTETFTLTLTSLSFDGDITPVADAQLIIQSDQPLPRILYNTDENGQVSLSFAHPGEYHISARKESTDGGVSVLSRPYAKVVVSGPQIEEPEPSPQVDLSAVAPLLPGGPVSYDMETGELYIRGLRFELSDALKPVLDETLNELYIPVRAWAEVMGVGVSWEAETATVGLTFGDYTVSFTTRDTFGDMPVKIINDRIHVPTAFFADAVVIDLRIIH